MAKRKNKKQKYEEVEYYSLNPETKKGIFIVFLFILAIIFVLSFLNVAGKAGMYIDVGLGLVFGWGRFLIPFILMGLGYVLARPNTYVVTIPNYIGLTLLLLSFQGLIHLKVPFSHSFELTLNGLGGGIIGYVIAYPLVLNLGIWAALIILLGVLLVAVLLTFNTGFENLLGNFNIFSGLPGFKKKEISDGEEDEEEELSGSETEIEGESDEEDGEGKEGDEKEEQQTRVENVKLTAKELLRRPKPVAPTIKVSKLRVDLPMSLLDDKQSKPTSGDTAAGAMKIQTTLENFNIDVEMGEIKVGPTVTQYTFKPAEGIKLSRITGLSNDLALALAAHPVRIEAPIPGKSLVGIEVPNEKPAIVRIRELLNSKAFRERKSNLEITLGKDVSGKVWTADLASMPHCLVAGSTGSGKSVCLNDIILSLLYQNNPETLRLILVDPKRVEFPVYNGIPHLLAPVITDVTKTVNALRWAIGEMDRRFDELSKVNKRNIASYNATAKDKMPYIVIIIDELADLMVSAAAEVEAAIIRLTQMARAIGIHLVVATQRPSVDVITGLIKANIPCRVAFSVASLMDSRTILDSAGAEKLVGKGDMLYMSPTTSKPRRLQGAYVSDEEIKRVVKFLKNACHDEPEYIAEITDKQGSSSFDYNGGGSEADDDLFEECRDIVLKAGKASASFLQRRLRIGYARAARLIDLLEEAGIVGPGDGAKPREILVDRTRAILNASENLNVGKRTVEIDDEREEDAEEEELSENEEEDEEELSGNYHENVTLRQAQGDNRNGAGIEQELKESDEDDDEEKELKENEDEDDEELSGNGAVIEEELDEGEGKEEELSENEAGIEEELDEKEGEETQKLKVKMGGDEENELF